MVYNINMKTTLIAFAAVIVTMAIIDGAWLATMSKSFYGVQLKHLMAASPNLLPAIIFYLIYAIALAVIIVVPATKGTVDYRNVFLLGLLFGLAAYGTYDLTNQATLKQWPTLVTIVDLTWGSLLTGTVSTVAVYVTKYFI